LKMLVSVTRVLWHHFVVFTSFLYEWFVHISELRSHPFVSSRFCFL
jgi:hypothetical protein